MSVTGILGKKVGMTQLFDNNGEVRPATVIKAGPCVVTQVKTQSKDGYDAAQIGLVEFVKETRLNQPMKGHFAKHNLPPVKFMREVAIVVDGAPHRRPDRGTDSATNREEQVLRAALAPRRQEVARGVRDPHAQASGRHPGTYAANGGCADEARPSGRCGRRDQGVRQRA